MNPYETPSAESTGPDCESAPTRGRPCPVCGSANTMTDTLLRSRPSILFVILFGWVFLLIRGAFSMRTEQCRDCGASNRYKSVGSWIALAVLILLVLSMTAALVTEVRQQ